MELQEGYIRTVDFVILLDLENSYNASARGLFNRNETVAFANFGGCGRRVYLIEGEEQNKNTGDRQGKKRTSRGKHCCN